MTSGTLLLRQVHPSWVQQGRATSQVFKPTPKDEKRLSVYDGDQVSAERAWHHYTDLLGHASMGVMAVTVGECQRQGLPVAADPTPFPEHVLIDFTGLAENPINRKAKQLKAMAEARGWQFLAEGSP
ncbi:MAG: hypothetical protein HZB55_08375 [Deltaproteobacteria bacterium]|nr:hypothetical protein [Deltaproteobacteria bacterium]